MNQENLSFLQDNLKYLGFGDSGPLYDQLREQVSKELKEFQLYTDAHYDEATKLEAALYFRRSDQLDMYFFNKYEALLVYADQPEKNRQQTFYISKGTGITMKEAYNLLQGRAVNKDLTNMEGEKYNAWIQLNFEEIDLHKNYKTKQYRAQYGYDLQKVLEKYPIRELQNEEMKKVLIRSLRRGNVQLVSFEKSSKTEKMYIEACPMYKTINIYPVAMKSQQKNNKKQAPPLSEEPTPDPVDPDQDGSGEEEIDVMKESNEMNEMNEVMEPAAVAASPTRKRVRR